MTFPHTRLDDYDVSLSPFYSHLFIHGSTSMKHIISCEMSSWSYWCYLSFLMRRASELRPETLQQHRLQHILGGLAQPGLRTCAIYSVASQKKFGTSSAFRRLTLILARGEGIRIMPIHVSAGLAGKGSTS